MSSPDSKQNFAAMRERILSENGKDYWRSVEEFADTPEFGEFVKREYPNHAEEWNDSLSRRNFIKFMGASLAFAGLSGCVIQPAEKIVPRVRPQEDLLPGRPLFFATAMTVGGIAMGLLAKSYEGRPIKLEGNPQHPGSLGATDTLAQASLLDMYDPDRSQEITYRGTPSTYQNFITSLRTAVVENGADGGAGVRFLTETVTSPTLQAQFKQVAAELPNAKWIQYEPVNTDNATAGARLAFGSPVNTVYKFDLADRILTLDKDIFSDFNVRYKADYAKRKNLTEENGEINRLYAVETTLTLTGAKADHRLAVKPSQMPEIAKAIAAAVGVAGSASTYTENAEWIAALGRDLQSRRGRSIVVAGDNQPPVVHALAHAMNAALGNVGQTVIYTEPLSPFAERTQVEQLRELIGDIDNGRVKMLVILGGNPVYNTPADLKLNRERMDKVPMRVHLGMQFDETAEICHWHISQKHYLETWSDARAYDGTVSIIQPLIAPLYDGKSVHEIVQLFFRENFDVKDYDIVKAYWQTQNMAAGPTASPAASPSTPRTEPAVNQPASAGRETITIAEAQSPTPAPSPASTPGASAAATFEDNWRKAVHDGVIANTQLAARPATVNAGFLSQPTPAPVNSGPIEFSILPDPSIYDGRFTNNGWLQELPNPLTKITWENVALVSPKTATDLQLNRGNDPDEISGGERGTAFINTHGSNMTADALTVTYQGAKINKPVPVWISPGQPDGVVTLFMGYGRTRAGRVGTGLGYNAFDVQRSDAMSFGSGSIEKTGEKAMIASTQIHFNMEGRDLLRVFDVDVFQANPHMADQENFYDKSMYLDAAKEYQKQYDQNHRWGMTIDLNSCVGCNACVLACQAENNIPVVGKEQVERSREMHWMRIDAYYTGGDVNQPDGLHFQPVLCQQCEQAPCEVVCPVTATVHNAEGLNDMVYNRCVGTRYCSNNCPYKVRRFNFLLYQDWETPQYKLMRNPEVSIRSRGVMEKCTYCTQRISAARIEAEKDGRRIADGEVVTACQSACPTGAIIFGDMNDPLSKIGKSKADKRGYNLLNELNTQPRTTYLAELKNQNKEMPDYKALVVPKTHTTKKSHDDVAPAGEAH
ncbi:MAG: TAT-variant-translocated molybdopterin oxidoreductase [Pyrinomonadaceae bacterium]